MLPFWLERADPLPAALRAVPLAMQAQEDPKQVFVGGIPKEASEDAIKKYFGNFGAVEYVKVMKDYNGVSRGFCFLKFSSQEEAELCLSKKDEHKIMEKWVDVKRIGEKSGTPDSDNEYKIFVGGIAIESTEDTLRLHFSNFASVLKVHLSAHLEHDSGLLIYATPDHGERPQAARSG